MEFSNSWVVNVTKPEMYCSTYQSSSLYLTFFLQINIGGYVYLNYW